MTDRTGPRVALVAKHAAHDVDAGADEPEELNLAVELVRTPHGYERARRLILGNFRARLEATGISADDFMQDVVAHLLHAQTLPGSRYDPSRGASVTTYLYAVAETTLKNATRRSGRYERWGRERPVPGDEPLDPPAPLPPEGGELGPTLARILELLDLDDEKVMAMHLLAGCSLPECAQRMGLRLSEAEELRTRVRALLSQLLDE